MILALLPPDERLVRLRAALRGPGEVVPCATWSEVTAACDRGDVEGVVFDLYADGAPDFERLRGLRARAPRAAMIAYVDPGRARLRDAFDAGRCGVEAFVVAGEDDAPEALAAILDRASGRSAASLFGDGLTAVRPVVRDAVMLSVTRAHERLTPDALARLVATSRRALTRRLAAAALPPPHHLLVWGRLVVAARLLENPARSAESVARALDYASPSAFRNTCRRYLDATPLEIRRQGGARFVVDRLLSGERTGRNGTRAARQAVLAG